MSNKVLQIVGIILALLLFVFAIIGLPLWVPFLIVAIVLILLLFKK
jgi:hypothetical protein